MQLFLQLHWIAIWAVIDFLVSALASAHVVLHKRNARAAAGWVGVIWLTPFFGTFVYILFGINRIHRHAKRKRPSALAEIEKCSPVVADEAVTLSPKLRDLANLSHRISGQPLRGGNSIRMLVGGDEAYPAMMDAIESASMSISFATYIFDRDQVGLRFVEALRRAVARGVEVRVLVDMVGASYCFPTIMRPLRQAGVRAAYFLPTLVPWRLHYSNLRNHRKLLIIDGAKVYTGGMNIRQGHDLGSNPRWPVRDVQFEITGPVVGQLQETFVIDWRFTTDELLSGPGWFPCPTVTGDVAARSIADGPDEDLDRTRKLLLGAIAVARSSIVILTPYFLPDDALITALNVAALRGVTVDILLPERGNLRFVQWATYAQLWQVLENGCRVWLTPSPFEHSKMMIIDNEWVLIGSSNWDSRSLRLNFELNVEIYSSRFAQEVSGFVDQRRRLSRPLSLLEVESRPLWKKLRDGVARLFSPYL